MMPLLRAAGNARPRKSLLPNEHERLPNGLIEVELTLRGVHGEPRWLRRAARSESRVSADATRADRAEQNLIVSVWINKGHVPEDGGKPWKHGTPHCRLLDERDRRGFPKQRVRNVDNKKPLSEHMRRRCSEPGCFGPREELRGRNIPTPSWLLKAKKLEPTKPPGSYWVYLLFDPDLKQFQVGKAKNLYSRLDSRWKATLHGGFGTPDGIPWLHDRLVENTSYEPLVEFVNYPTSEQALAAERAKRRELRAAGWYDSSDV